MFYKRGGGKFLREEKITRIRNLIFRGSKQILWSGASLCELALTSPETLKLFSLCKISSHRNQVQGKEDRRRMELGCPDATLLTISNKRWTSARQNTNDGNNNCINLVTDLDPPIRFHHPNNMNIWSIFKGGRIGIVVFHAKNRSKQ